MTHNPRKYIRHPSDHPIGLNICDKICKRKLKNLSEGGVCLLVDEAVTPGTEVTVSYPAEATPFEATGIVAWCSLADDAYEIGIQFSRPEDRFGVRMMEQISHIEHYRTKVQQEEGRRLSAEQAASEWIGKHATHFPDL